MPWDETELSLLRLEPETGLPAPGSKPTVVAGADGKTSVLQPAWSPLTGELFFVSDHENGYWNLFALDVDKHAHKATNVMPMLADFSGAAPGWALGQQGYAFAKGTGDVLAAVRLPGEASSTLLVFAGAEGHAKKGEHSGEAGGLPFSFGGLTTSPDGSKLYLLGASPERPGGVYEWTGLAAPAAPAVMLASSMRASAVIEPKYISSPQLRTFPTTDEAQTGITHAHGYYYPPTNGDFAPPAGELPPLLVKAHGGPTACTGSAFNPAIQFWTSRGFAVMDVDYRGSTGYGRGYRNALRGNWGIVDIEDGADAAPRLTLRRVRPPPRPRVHGTRCELHPGPTVAHTLHRVPPFPCSVRGRQVPRAAGPGRPAPPLHRWRLGGRLHHARRARVQGRVRRRLLALRRGRLLGARGGHAQV